MQVRNGGLPLAQSQPRLGFLDQRKTLIFGTSQLPLQVRQRRLGGLNRRAQDGGINAFILQVVHVLAIFFYRANLLHDRTNFGIVPIDRMPDRCLSGLDVGNPSLAVANITHSFTTAVLC